MMINLLRVYIAIASLRTLTLLEGHKCDRKINCMLRVLDSSPLEFKRCVFATYLKKDYA